VSHSGSLNTVIQFLGRAIRPKGDGYPAPRRDRARVVFLVPCGGPWPTLSIDHSRNAVLTCCLLTDREAGQQSSCCGTEASVGVQNQNRA
jgi:hypothetical protein